MRVPLFEKKLSALRIRLTSLVLLVAALLSPACAGDLGAPGPEEAGNQGNEEADDARLNPDDPLARDAETYAKDQEVSPEEAVRRLRLQEDVSLDELQPALVENEPDYLRRAMDSAPAGV